MKPDDNTQKPQSGTSSGDEDRPQVPDARRDPNAQGGVAGSEATPSSTDVRTQIEAALRDDPSLSNVNVNVTENTVELTGSVENGQDRQNVLGIAQSYAGGRRVVDRLTVKGRGKA